LSSPTSPHNAAFDFFTISILVLFVGILAFQVRTAVHREILHYDEGWYLCEARGLRALIQSAPSLLRHKEAFSKWKMEIRQKGLILPPGNGKPSFILLLAMTMLLPVREACAGDFLTITSCFFGVLCFFFLCRKFGSNFRESAALTLLFFMSPIWNYYSVTTIANPLSAAVLLAGILCYVNGKWFWACFLFGFSFTVHYTAITVAGILFCAMTLELWQELPSRRNPWSAWIKYSVVLLLPFLVWQALYLIGRWLTKDHLSDVVYRTYWEQLTYNYGRVTTGRPSTWVHTFYRNLRIFSALARTETWPVAALLIASPFMVLVYWRKMQIRERALGLAALIVPAFWIINPGTVVSRVVLTFLPLLYLSSVLVVSRWERLRRFSPRIKVTALIVLMGFSLNQTVRNGQKLRSPFRDAVFYLKQHGFSGQIADSESWPVWQFYQRTRMGFRPEIVMTDIARLRQEMNRAIAENRPQAVPVIIYNGQPVWGNGEAYAAFSHRLFSLSPSVQWPMPYAHIPAFIMETDRGMREADRPGSVTLYWVDKASMKRLFPG